MINIFEKIISFLLSNKLCEKLKLSVLLRIAMVKVIQIENRAKKITIIEANKTQDLCPQGSFPRIFNLSVYREINSDLDQLSDEELRAHYNQIGCREGRTCSRVRSRKDFIDVISNFEGERLEIGPFCSPILAQNSETYFSDYLNTAELRLEAIEQKQDPDDVPNIDFPTKEVSLNIAVGAKKFSIVVSCHNIEHYPCFVTHLQEVSAILMSGGHYFLIIPDKRYSADYYHKSSMLPEVLAAYAEKRKIPNIENILKGTEFITHSYPQRHWMNDHGINPYQALHGMNLSVSLEQIIQSIQSGKYNDLHCWRFTPQSFIGIIGSLNEMKLIDLRAVRIYPTLFGSNEFFVVLRKAI